MSWHGWPLEAIRAAALDAFETIIAHVSARPAFRRTAVDAVVARLG